MAKSKKFLKDLRDRGLTDERNLTFVTDVNCTNGLRGRVWITVCGTNLFFCEPDGLRKIGEVLMALDLTQTRMTKCILAVFYTKVRLECGNLVYDFRHTTDTLAFVRMLKEAGCKK